MDLLYAFGLFIFSVSMLNLIRISVFSILADWYDLKRHRLRKKSAYRPFISVIIPAHNERAVLERCLTSVYKSNYSRFEVIVVDDGSTDTTACFGHYLRRKHDFKNLRIIRNVKNGGKASAINYGVMRYAKGNIMVAMDADCELDPQALALGVQYFRNREINAVASNVKVMRGAGVLGVTQLLEYMLAYRLKKAHSVLNIEYLAGCTSFFRISAVKRAGFYDEDTIAEDFDFSLKLIRNVKGKIYYADDVICYTEGVISTKDLYRQRYRWRFGSFQAFYKNKNMFFNRKEGLNKFLTFALLPWLLFCELLFLFEPLLVGSMLFYAFLYHSLVGIEYGFALYASLTSIAILADDFITLRDKIKLLLIAPFAYILFMIINYVGYASLVKSLVKSRGIINPARSAAGWISPARSVK